MKVLIATGNGSSRVTITFILKAHFPPSARTQRNAPVVLNFLKVRTKTSGRVPICFWEITRCGIPGIIRPTHRSGVAFHRGLFINVLISMCIHKKRPHMGSVQSIDDKIFKVSSYYYTMQMININNLD